MSHRVRIEEREAILAMSRRRPVMLTEIGPVLGQTFGELYGYLALHGVDPAGPPFVIYHDMPSPGLPLDVEVCAPIVRSIEPAPGCTVGYLPGGSFATVIHHGPYESIGSTYEELDAWARRHHRAFTGPPRETYLSDPSTPPADIRTMVEWPVSEERVPAGATS